MLAVIKSVQNCGELRQDGRKLKSDCWFINEGKITCHFQVMQAEHADVALSFHSLHAQLNTPTVEL